MFGIGLPEMIVILAVALIVVGPDKLPDMARSIAKWMFELKKTVNEVKNSLTDEDNLIGSVQSDLRKTADDLKGELLESDDNLTWHEPGSPSQEMAGMENEIIDADDLKPISDKVDPYPKGQDKGESKVEEEEDSPDNEADKGKMKDTPPDSSS
jgi:sec-independent protein translocase protein TatB